MPPESPTLGLNHLQFEALLAAARTSVNPYDFALICLLGLLGLRIFETVGANIDDLGEEHGHRVLKVRAKATKSSSCRYRRRSPAQSNGPAATATPARSCSTGAAPEWTGTPQPAGYATSQPTPECGCPACTPTCFGVRDASGFLLRQRGLRRKTIAAMRSCLADFLEVLAAAGQTPRGLADRLPPHRHVRHESEPHLWTADEIRRMLAGIDRQSATGKRDYAMILTTARLGLRISDLRRLELGDLDWRAKQITIVQHKTGRSLSLPLLDDVGWAIIDYVRSGRPETVCPKVFIKHRHPFDAFGCASSVATRLSRHAARAGIEFPPDRVCGMHSLRGALAVAMIGDGTPIPVVSAVLGHASSDTTQAYYLRFDVERLRGCALDVEDVTERDRAGEPGA